MANLDTCSVNISPPTIARHFDATDDQVAWVSLACNLALASLLVTFGRLGGSLLAWGPVRKTR